MDPGDAEGDQPAAPVSRLRRFVTPTLGDVVFVSLFSFAMALGVNLFQRDGDLGRHIRLGRAILDHGRLPTVDVYSYTMAGGRMIPHEWVAQAVFAGTERLFGFDGIAVLTAVAASLPWFVLYRFLVNRDTGPVTAAGLCLLGGAASVIHWATRPHIFTWIFVVIWIMALEDLRTGRRRSVWALVPLATLWANTHGAFIVGFVLIGTYLLGMLFDSRLRPDSAQRSRLVHLVVVGLGTTVASLLNPAGLSTIVNGFSYAREDFLLAFTTEYNSPDFHSLLTWPFLGLLLLTVVLRIRWTWTTGLLTLVWTALALYSFRNVPIYAIVVLPVVASAFPLRSWPAFRWADRLREYGDIERRATGGALGAVFVVVVAFALASTPGSSYGFSRGAFPVAAVEAMGDQPYGDRVFNLFQWGGYLEYCCWPKVRVFIDGQTDYYGSALTEEYDLTVRGAPGWDRVLDTYDVDWVLISPEVALAQILRESSEWRETYRDDVSVVFVRDG